MSDFEFLSVLLLEGCKDQRDGIDILSQNSEILVFVSVFKRFILKSPINIHVQPCTQSNFKG